MLRAPPLNGRRTNKQLWLVNIAEHLAARYFPQEMAETFFFLFFYVRKNMSVFCLLSEIMQNLMGVTCCSAVNAPDPRIPSSGFSRHTVSTWKSPPERVRLPSFCFTTIPWKLAFSPRCSSAFVNGAQQHSTLPPLWAVIVIWFHCKKASLVQTSTILCTLEKLPVLNNRGEQTCNSHLN